MSNNPVLRSPLVRRGVVGSAAMLALVLLMVFYSVVAGAVDRAKQRRVAGQLEAAAAFEALRPSPRAALAVQPQPIRAASFGSRSVAYLH